MRNRRGILLALALLGLATLPACSFYSGADPHRGSQALAISDLPEGTWPTRTTGDLLTDLDAATPERVSMSIPYRLGHGHDGSTASNGRSYNPDEFRLKARIVAKGVYGRGLIRQFASVEPEEQGAAIPDTLVIPHELLEGMQFVSVPRNGGPTGDALSQFREDQPERYRRFIQRRLGLRPSSGDTWQLTSRGTRMRLYEPSGDFQNKVSRGLIVHLSSLAGLEFELPIVRELTNRGWAVLVLNASTARRDEPPVFINANGDMAAPGSRLAGMIDNRVAEIAYAAEAGVEFLAEHAPKVQTNSIVIVGYSAGALTAPAVAELLHERVSAVVLVGGGANLLDISQRSSLTNGGIELIWRDDLKTPQAMKQLNDAYLTKTKLDPYVLAPRLCGKPVLMLHGAFDDIIPSDTGELLRQRLGRCDCFTFTLGHRGVFLFLPQQARKIANWIDERVSER
jgi:predicted esterase